MNRLIDQLLAAALIGVFFGPYVKFSQFLGVRSGNTETGTKIKTLAYLKMVFGPKQHGTLANSISLK